MPHADNLIDSIVIVSLNNLFAESIFFWLNVIYLFAVLKQNMTPQVILVGTHYDKLPKATRDALIEKFFRDFRYEIAETPLKDLVSYDFVVDNSTKEDEKFSKIKSEIFRLAKRQPDWGKKTPSKWLSLEREIQCQKESGLKVLSTSKKDNVTLACIYMYIEDLSWVLMYYWIYQTSWGKR